MIVVVLCNIGFVDKYTLNKLASRVSQKYVQTKDAELYTRLNYQITQFDNEYDDKWRCLIVTNVNLELKRLFQNKLEPHLIQS